MSTYQTSVPAVSITETGIALPPTQEILNGTLQDINQAFGGNLNIKSVSTPQYVLASEQAQAIALSDASLAFALSQFDPDKAMGRWQDAIGHIYFLERKAGTPTVVNATCTGIPGVTLPTGSLARDTQDNVYRSLSAATFGEDGQALVPFANTVSGAIPCAAGALVYIQVAVSGWDAITNLQPGIVGTEVEGRDAFELRRQEAVALNAMGTVAAIRANVLSLDDVTDCYVIDNDTGDTVEKGTTNYPLKPHSVYVAVVGGDDDEIAKTIWRKKDLGCDMNGNTRVTVYDDSALAQPYPEYQILFNRPASIPILYEVKIRKDALLPQDIVSLIQNAIVNAFNGLVEGFARERIGDLIYASSYYSVVSAVSARVSIISILIGTETPNQTILEMGIDQVPLITPDNITVTLQ